MMLKHVISVCTQRVTDVGETLSRYWAQSTDTSVLDGAQRYP